MKPEQNYDFLKRFKEIHQPGRRTAFRPAADGEIIIDGGWHISVATDAPAAALRAACDFQDYMLRSMEVSLPVMRGGKDGASISFSRSAESRKRGAFEVRVSTNSVVVSGDDERGILRGGVYLEDMMNLAEGPYLNKGDLRKEPLLRMRLIHSGSGIDDYPDWQLNAILHAGFTAIDLFVRGIDINGKHENCDINDIIERADALGLDTILYNYMKCFKHPDDSDADERLDAVYGGLFRHYPKAAGISLVGESLEFPSRDERTTGKTFLESAVDGIPDTRPSPGWFPCRDYPAFLEKIVRCVRRVKPDAEIIFSTYNWSYLSASEREKFLAECPKELTINIAFEMQRVRKIEGLRFPVMDYTASVAEPGEYFLTESAAAHKNGLKIRVCSNTGGNAWDFGAAPYIPVPQLWLKRMRALLPFAKDCGADSFYEGHHFGWWPNVANDLMKKLYMSPETALNDDEFLRCLALRDYGTERVADVWALWSKALTHITTSNEDQYGPLRVGPSYPFVFQVNMTRTMLPKEIPFPCSDRAMFGNSIIKTLYRPYENAEQSPGSMRYPVDLRELSSLLEIWGQGSALLDTLIPAMQPGRKRAAGEYLRALGGYAANSIKTVINIKEWYLSTVHLNACAVPEEAKKMLDILAEIAAREHKNVLDTIQYVETDSRLGWEPSMEYVCDRRHLEWKLRQLTFALTEIEQYRKTFSL